jgi:hypothetical protein
VSCVLSFCRRKNFATNTSQSTIDLTAIMLQDFKMAPMNNVNDHKELPGPWAKTYDAKTKEDMLEAYSEWSSTYDEDSVNKFGYAAPMRSAQVLSEHLGRRGLLKEVLIADIGKGSKMKGCVWGAFCNVLIILSLTLIDSGRCGNWSCRQRAERNGIYQRCRFGLQP